MSGPNAVLAATVAVYLAIVIPGYLGVAMGWPAGAHWAVRTIYDFQTLIVGVAGLSSIAFLAQQIRLQRRKHQLDMQMAWKPERDALGRIEATCVSVLPSLREPPLVGGAPYVPPALEGELLRIEAVAPIGLASMYRRLNELLVKHNLASDQFRATSELRFEEEADGWRELGLKITEELLKHTRQRIAQIDAIANR